MWVSPGACRSNASKPNRSNGSASCASRTSVSVRDGLIRSVFPDWPADDPGFQLQRIGDLWRAVIEAFGRTYERIVAARLQPGPWPVSRWPRPSLPGLGRCPDASGAARPAPACRSLRRQRSRPGRVGNRGRLAMSCHRRGSARSFALVLYGLLSLEKRRSRLMRNTERPVSPRKGRPAASSPCDSVPTSGPQRIADAALVAGLVGGKPGLVHVGRQLPEEAESIGRKALEGRWREVLGQRRHRFGVPQGSEVSGSACALPSVGSMAIAETGNAALILPCSTMNRSNAA